MSDMIRTWEGNEWQEHVQVLLKHHYGPGQYQEVADRDRGDFGIEGFSRNGCAYQCYAAAEPLTTDGLYNKQRTKITNDIGKFIRNKSDLVKTFGPTKISRWILMVPRYESARLVQHAEKKAQEVRDALLPYVATDFYIHIATEEEFAAELAVLVNTGAALVDIDPGTVEREQIDQWLTHVDNVTLVDNLRQKTAKLPSLRDPEDRDKFAIEMVRHFLAGQTVLSNMHDSYPDVWRSILRSKNGRERFLGTESLLNGGTANEMLGSSMNTYKNEISQNTKASLSSSTLNTLAYEAISDWLLRCPLNF